MHARENLSDRLDELKRELVVLLGGTFCEWEGDEEECERCEWPVPGRSLVFYGGSYEYPDDGNYACIDCFLSETLAPPMTKSMEESMERDFREHARKMRVENQESIEAARTNYIGAQWEVANAI